VFGLDGATAPSNRIGVAAIGLGFGWRMFLRHDTDTRYVAVCDVQKDRRDNGKRIVDEEQGGSDCQVYNDFREVLARPDVDAVYIATPDHWHAPIVVAAARAGKHIYCQKPLTRTIAEGQAVVAAGRRHGIVFQHGTQQRRDPKMLFGCELVRNGYIGRVRHVKIGSPAGIICDPQLTEAVPPGLDWNQWLGPAPWAPFTPLRIQAHPWYHISDYSMGYIAGWGVHHADSAAQACGLDNPGGFIEVDARGLFPPDGLYDNPYRWQINFRFANGVTWHWTDTDGENESYVGFGSRPPPPADWEQHPMGIRIEGDEGWVQIWRNKVDAYPKSLLQGPLRHSLPQADHAHH
jgi:predicted dehydrogenase